MFYRIENIGIIKDLLSMFPYLEIINNYYTMLIISLISNMISYIVISYTLCLVYNQHAKIKQFIFAGVIIVLFYQLPIFTINMLRQNYISFHIEDFFVVSPPYFIYIIFFVSVYILKINKNKCLYVVVKQYYLLIIKTLIYFILIAFAFYAIENAIEYQYIIYIGCLTLTNFLHITILLLLAKYVKKKKLWFEGYVQQSDLNVYSRLNSIFFRLLPLFIFILVIMDRLYITKEIFLILIILICMIFIFILLFSYNYYNDILIFTKSSLEIKQLHIKSLIDSINSFRNVEYDLENMMHIYDKYIKQKDYKSLISYHNEFYKITKDAGDLIDISQRMEENPALYSVLYSKIKFASSQDIFISVTIGADTSKLSVHPIDLSRMIGILLDNAIEETARTSKKTIHFSTSYRKINKRTKSNKIQIAITNPTLDDVNIKEIFEMGYTTKKEHTGLGLYELWEIVSKTPDFDLHAEYINNTITFYLSMPCFEGS